MISPRGGDFHLATSGDHNLAVDMRFFQHRTEYLTGCEWHLSGMTLR